MSTTWTHAILAEMGARAPRKAGRAMPLRDADDATLARAARKGGIEAFEELVRRYRNDVFGIAFHYLRNREEAWDASQEVFIKAHRSIRRFRGDASFKTWVLRITANHCKDVIKKRKLDTVGLEASGTADRAQHPAPNPEEHASAQEIGAAIETALERMPEKHRTAIVLREFEGLSYQEMAEIMNCSMGTVMSRLHHARKKLQQLLIQSGVVEGVYHE